MGVLWYVDISGMNKNNISVPIWKNFGLKYNKFKKKPNNGVI